MSDDFTALADLHAHLVEQTRTEEERAAAQAARELAAREQLITLRVNARPAWWVFAHEEDIEGFRSTVYGDEDFTSGMLFFRLVGHDPELFDLFKAQSRDYQRRFIAMQNRAGLPPTKHPLQLSDPVTGEYAWAA